MDAVLVRIAAVALALVSAGWVVVFYLLAWIVIPPSGGRSPHRVVAKGPATAGTAIGARDAWAVAGTQLRTLTGGLRNAGPALEPQTEGSTLARSPVQVLDKTMTAMGDRLRDEQVQESARQAASSLAAAVGASIDQLARRGPAPTPSPDSKLAPSSDPDSVPPS